MAIDKDRLAALVDADTRTIPEIAASAGLAEDTLYKLLRGERTDPHLSTARGLATALSCAVEDLCSEVEASA